MKRGKGGEKEIETVIERDRDKDIERGKEGEEDREKRKRNTKETKEETRIPPSPHLSPFFHILTHTHTHLSFW